jgi:hypothetical protein
MRWPKTALALLHISHHQFKQRLVICDLNVIYRELHAFASVDI